MDLVAREASVARRTVYNQFESKEALFIASVERVWSEFPVVEITADESVLSDPAAGLSIRNINAMYYPLCQLYLRPVARVSNGYFSGISEVVVIKIDAI